MSKALEDLIQMSKTVRMTAADEERQRRSFAYGNAMIENGKITREMIDIAAGQLTTGNRQTIDQRGDKGPAGST